MMGCFLFVGILIVDVGMSMIIAGVDDVSVRSVLDFTRNSYCNTFIEFLTSINCCMLNGRVGNNNDFTCVSSKGQSVIDYCIVSYEIFICFKTLKLFGQLI
jgi:hypothetical protein